MMKRGWLGAVSKAQYNFVQGNGAYIFGGELMVIRYTISQVKKESRC
jgi:hypothetical protein